MNTVNWLTRVPKHLIQAACFPVLLKDLVRVRLDLAGQLLHEGTAPGPLRDGLLGVLILTAVFVTVTPPALEATTIFIEYWLINMTVRTKS